MKRTILVCMLSLLAAPALAAGASAAGAAVSGVSVPRRSPSSRVMKVQL